MSVKSVFKKKLKIKSPITKKKKNQKHKYISETSVDSYVKIDTNNFKGECLVPNKVTKSCEDTEFQLKRENCHETSIDNDVIVESIKKIKKKRKSEDHNINNKYKSPKKKKVSFAPDVKCEKDDQKCTAGNMKPLSLNKRKKINYLKKLKAKKQKQKNAKKNEENSIAKSISRKEQAITYLMQWKNDLPNWKFKKNVQLWLIKNTYDPANVSALHNRQFKFYLLIIKNY